MDKDDQKEGFFKRLKNIESKAKGENKKQSEPIKNEEQSVPIKNEEQSEPIKGQLTMTDKKPKEIVPLKDRLDKIFENFGLDFNSTGKKFLKRLAKCEEETDYDNLFFKIDDNFIVKSVDFLK